MAQTSSRKRFHVTGIGNALVDILAPVSDAFLAEHGIEKGMMTLVDRTRAARLYEQIGPAREVSGGSVANSLAILAHLGANCAFIGKIGADQLGTIFSHDLQSQGAQCHTPRLPAKSGEETGRCISLITPDGERTMSTYLGANTRFGANDLDDDLLTSSDWVFLEGYQFDSPQGRDAYRQAANITRKAGGKVALTLSDPNCVTRNLADMQRFAGITDAIFCNQKELLALFPGAGISEASELALERAPLLVCTNGGKGISISTRSEFIHIPVTPVVPKDATGAGDSFAGAFLWALTQGHDLNRCGKIAARVAAEIIQTSGARPERDLGLLLEESNLLSQHETA